ncbi:uncharacterized protein PgNI_01611 [Pyricularia grisea]|uniref:Uncharacterized protein n=1 Tax=Pyricularia grisea TaxID=148305 RepID=A0A6P8BK73_PYRGI|nr:uncharacterized protein PgNI_01611 [Pyricularia grisea]TLD17198.1 hypothetical protein PgNI_01611 [Pyricularia grisea]
MNPAMQTVSAAAVGRIDFEPNRPLENVPTHHFVAGTRRSVRQQDRIFSLTPDTAQAPNAVRLACVWRLDAMPIKCKRVQRYHSGALLAHTHAAIVNGDEHRRAANGHLNQG